MKNRTKVYGGGLATIDGMGMVTTFGVGVKMENGKASGHFFCSINPPGPEMIVNGPVKSAEFEDGKVTLKGTDKTWGRIHCDSWRRKIGLNLDKAIRTQGRHPHHRNGYFGNYKVRINTRPRSLAHRLKREVSNY